MRTATPRRSKVPRLDCLSSLGPTNMILELDENAINCHKMTKTIENLSTMMVGT